VTSALFRQEVLEGQKAQWLGAVGIARPPSFAWITGISIVLALAGGRQATGDRISQAPVYGLRADSYLVNTRVGFWTMIKNPGAPWPSSLQR
jgi:hypothetical protein